MIAFLACTEPKVNTMPALESMSRTEKLQLMESLWEDLTRDTPDLPSPTWHAQALEAAREAHANGQADFIDWSQAKRMLRDE